MLVLKNLAVAAALVCGSLVAAPELAQAQSQSDAAKLADVQKLLNLTGVANLGIQAMDQMLQNLKGSMPQVPEKAWTEFRKEVNTDGLLSTIATIYDKHLTHAEVKELIKFYESPVGKKMISVMPAITAESMQAGNKWGNELAQRANQKLAAPKK
jgi:hypothetical protein